MGSKPDAWAAIRVRQSSVSNPTIGAMALRPSRSALTKAACVVPNAETTPTPDTLTEGCTDAYVTMSAMRHHTAVRGSARPRWAVPSAVIVFAAAAILTAQQKPADDESFDALYRRGSEINATFKTLTARFTETTTSSMLTRPLVASGVVAVERPSRVVLHYHQPELRDVLIDGDRLTVSWPGRHIRDVTNIAAANRRIQKYFVDSSPAELRESFDIVS